MSNNIITPKIISSLSHDPWFNLALEEYLLSNIAANQVVLYLWQNENTVVIGKHQNPWKECRLAELAGEGGRLARRISGGGAVYHDLGNLNFSLIMDKNLYNLEHQLQIILQAVRDLGIPAEFSGRNDLAVKGRKFSGNAYHWDTHAALHHGTILVRADLSKLTRYLTVHPQKILSKGIDSVRSRVMNLSDLCPGLTTESMAASLKRRFCQHYGAAASLTARFDTSLPDLDVLYRRHASWAWLYGETPQFAITLSNYFSWGTLEIQLNLENGMVTAANVYSDAMDTHLIEAIAAKLNEIPYQAGHLPDRLLTAESRSENRTIIYDISSWLTAQGLIVPAAASNYTA